MIINFIVIVIKNGPSPCIQFLFPVFDIPISSLRGFGSFQFPMNPRETENYYLWKSRPAKIRYYKTSYDQITISSICFSLKPTKYNGSTILSHVVMACCTWLFQTSILLPSSVRMHISTTMPVTRLSGSSGIKFIGDIRKPKNIKINKYIKLQNYETS